MVQFQLSPSPPGIPSRIFYFFRFLAVYSPPLGTQTPHHRDSKIKHKYIIFVQNRNNSINFKPDFLTLLLKNYKYSMKNHTFLKRIKLTASQEFCSKYITYVHETWSTSHREHFYAVQFLFMWHVFIKALN